MINRSAVVIRPKQPFIDWATGLEEQVNVSDVSGDETVYLLPQYDMDDDAMQLVLQYWEYFFESELDGWWVDKSVWPKNRTAAMFLEWFDLEFHSMVEDMCDFPVKEEDS